MKSKRAIILFFSGFIIVAVLIVVMNTVAQRRIYVRPGSVAKPGEHKWAVIIGINSYQEPIQDLPYAVNDAESIYEIIVHKDYGGFETKKVNLLTDKSRKRPTRRNILKSLKNIEKVADSDDTVFLFFAGHGIEESGRSYFLPSDADVSILADTGIPMDRFTKTLNRTNAKVQVMFFDACHSGARKDRSSSGRLSQRAFSRIFEDANGRAVLSSCKAGEVSWEYSEKEHGVFTYYLTEALKGEADTDVDGFVSVSETSNYVTEKVKEWSFNTGKTQNPRLLYNVSGDIVLTLSQGSSTNQPPQIAITTPSVSNGGQVTLNLSKSGEIQIEGRITDDVAIQQATVNNTSLSLGRGGRFSVFLPVSEGQQYSLHFHARDTSGKEDTYDFTIAIPKMRKDDAEKVSMKKNKLVLLLLLSSFSVLAIVLISVIMSKLQPISALSGVPIGIFFILFGLSLPFYIAPNIPNQFLWVLYLAVSAIILIFTAVLSFVGNHWSIRNISITIFWANLFAPLGAFLLGGGSPYLTMLIGEKIGGINIGELVDTNGVVIVRMIIGLGIGIFLGYFLGLLLDGRWTINWMLILGAIGGVIIGAVFETTGMTVFAALSGAIGGGIIGPVWRRITESKIDIVIFGISGWIGVAICVAIVLVIGKKLGFGYFNVFVSSAEWTVGLGLALIGLILNVIAVRKKLKSRAIKS